MITPAFRLAEHGVQHIVHAVGPIWDEPDEGDPSTASALLDAQLQGAYRSSLELAVSVHARSIAFPAISTGIYGFPAERAAAIAVRTVSEFDGELDHIVLVAFDDSSSEILNEALAAR